MSALAVGVGRRLVAEDDRDESQGPERFDSKPQPVRAKEQDGCAKPEGGAGRARSGLGRSSPNRSRAAGESALSQGSGEKAHRQRQHDEHHG